MNRRQFFGRTLGALAAAALMRQPPQPTGILALVNDGPLALTYKGVPVVSDRDFVRNQMFMVGEQWHRFEGVTI